MRNLLIALVLVTTIVGCDEGIPFPDPGTTDPSEATIIGRWVLDGFEDNIRYDFTADKRYTIYGTDGFFPTLEEFLDVNPNFPGNDWFYDGDTVVIDLNFGNISRLVPDFKCENNVLAWILPDGTSHTSLYREGHDISACN